MFTLEQCEQLLDLLKPTNSSPLSFAFSVGNIHSYNMSVIPCSFAIISVVNACSHNPWIIDTRVTDHIIHSQLFHTYS